MYWNIRENYSESFLAINNNNIQEYVDVTEKWVFIWDQEIIQEKDL